MSLECSRTRAIGRPGPAWPGLAWDAPSKEMRVREQEEREVECSRTRASGRAARPGVDWARPSLA